MPLFSVFCFTFTSVSFHVLIKKCPVFFHLLSLLTSSLSLPPHDSPPHITLLLVLLNPLSHSSVKEYLSSLYYSLLPALTFTFMHNPLSYHSLISSVENYLSSFPTVFISLALMPAHSLSSPPLKIYTILLYLLSLSSLSCLPTAPHLNLPSLYYSLLLILTFLSPYNPSFHCYLVSCDMNNLKFYNSLFPFSHFHAFPQLLIPTSLKFIPFSCASSYSHLFLQPLVSWLSHILC